jgi:hypothetical protein
LQYFGLIDLFHQFNIFSRKVQGKFLNAEGMDKRGSQKFVDEPQAGERSQTEKVLAEKAKKGFYSTRI